MPKKSKRSKIVRKAAADIPAASAADLDRLRAAMELPIDTSDIDEQPTYQRLNRDAGGRLPARKSMVRDAIIREMQRLKLTSYRLWKDAKEHCPTLSQSAVHEFIKGQRQLELPYAEALMAAVQLRVIRISPRIGRRTPPKQSA